MHVVVTGSHGFVGSALVSALVRDGHRVTTLVRGEATPVKKIDRISWDPGADTFDLSVAGNIDAIVHLAGVPVAGKRWNPEYKALIRDSRVRSTRLISKAAAALPKPPPAMIVASAMGYYGDRGEDVLTEESGPGEGFLAEAAVEWERSADPAREAGIRVVHARFGNVLGRGGGVVSKLKIPYQTGFAGPIGSGRQWWPWIALEDALSAIMFTIDHDEFSGPVNFVAPGITRQRGFASKMAGALRRPSFVPLPAWALRLMVGEVAVELLSSQRMVPQVLEQNGFDWRGPDLETTFHHIFRARSESEWR